MLNIFFHCCPTYILIQGFSLTPELMDLFILIGQQAPGILWSLSTQPVQKLG